MHMRTGCAKDLFHNKILALAVTFIAPTAVRDYVQTALLTDTLQKTEQLMTVAGDSAIYAQAEQ